VVLEKYMN